MDLQEVAASPWHDAGMEPQCSTTISWQLPLLQKPAIIAAMSDTTFGLAVKAVTPDAQDPSNAAIDCLAETHAKFAPLSNCVELPTHLNLMRRP